MMAAARALERVTLDSGEPTLSVWRATLSALLSTFCGRGDPHVQSTIGGQYTPDDLCIQCARAKRGMVVCAYVCSLLS